MIIQNSKIRRLNRVRHHVARNLEIPRLSVFRSNQHIWAQIIDDKEGKTLVGTSSKALKSAKGTKSEIATIVGQELAKLAKDKKIINVRFDRGFYRYHGRVKSLAEGARSGGLKF